MDKPSTREKIQPFIEQYELDPSDFEKTPEDFEHFNDFFYRKLKPTARPIHDAPAVFPADGRHLGFQNAEDIQGAFIKGQKWNLRALIDNDELYEVFKGGSLVLSRLCPVDYHRFHFPCSGTPSENTVINGPLFSVSPIALRQQLAYMWQNKRTRTVLDSPDFGKVLIQEIGATCVGSIHQTFTPGQPVQKGDEKGYFAFGGSSTITIFQPGKIKLAQDLVENSAQQRELYARIGDFMGEPT